MNTHNEFTEFNSKVRLLPSKRDKLKTHRKSLRQRIKDYFTGKEWLVPKFASQGSFPLQTNVNPIRTKDEDGEVIEEYDLDDGVYFVCSQEERETARKYHDRILEAVDGQTKSSEGKHSCVRVIYSDGHHVDLPVYWMENDDDIPQLGRPSEGYSDSDPKAFKDWVDAQIDATNNVGQLRRVIRYLKAWKNYRETSSSSLQLPPGVTLTILACNHFAERDDDDDSFRETCRSIRDALKISFSCYRPTTPIGEDLLAEFHRDTVIGEFDDLVDHADEADAVDSKEDACAEWRQVFGERFPKGSNGSKKKADAANIVTATAHQPWARD